MSSANSYGDPDTRRRILEAALEVIAEKGTALSLKDVAGRSGVSRQALYLHFGDRTGLVVALVQFMDEVAELGASLDEIHRARSAGGVIRRVMETHAAFSALIDPVALILESAQYDDEALGAAWRDRMRFRVEAHRGFVQRIADLGELDEAWTVVEAAELFYAITLVNPWRELTRELGWSREEYVDRMTKLLERALLGKPT